MKKCNVCGNLVDDDAMFCTKCGNGAAQTAPQSAPQPAPQSAPQPIYQNAPQQININMPVNDRTIEIKTFIFMFFMNCLGLIGLIYDIVIACSNEQPTTKRNYAKAYLIWSIAFIVVAVIIGILFGSAILALLGGLAYSL